MPTRAQLRKRAVQHKQLRRQAGAGGRGRPVAGNNPNYNPTQGSAVAGPAGGRGTGYKGGGKGKGNKSQQFTGGAPGGGGGGKDKPPRWKTVVTPATPGQASPVIDPFMNADDMMAYGEARSKLNDTIGQIDYGLQTQLADNNYEKSQIDRGATLGRRNADFEAAGRGLFHSSIRDAELFDIDATAGIRKTFLDRAFDTQTMDAQRQKLGAKQAFDEFQVAMNKRMVENAQRAAEEAGLGPWLVEPTEETSERVRTKYGERMLERRERRQDRKGKGGKGKGGKGGGKSTKFTGGAPGPKVTHTNTGVTRG